MEDFMKSMAIFQKYMKGDVYAPFNATHDLLQFCCVCPNDVSTEDLLELSKLGWFVGEYGDFSSYRYGSC